MICVALKRNLGGEDSSINAARLGLQFGKTSIWGRTTRMIVETLVRRKPDVTAILSFNLQHF